MYIGNVGKIPIESPRKFIIKEISDFKISFDGGKTWDMKMSLKK